MNRPAKIVCFSLLLMPAIAMSAPGANGSAPRADSRADQRTETVIYKHVDENGRVTYANSPIKGGARIDLEPLTVIPATPSGSLNAANAQFVSPQTTTRMSMQPVAVAVVTTTPPAANPPKPVQVATVVPVSSSSSSFNQQQTPFIRPAATAPDNNVLASVDAMNQLTQQRQAEIRKRLLEGELQTEEQLLVSAKSRLDEEQKLSGSIRAMRASFAATSETVTAQKPLISPETRAEIERHFERVRNLQDQVAMHENHLQTLRGQLSTLR